MKFTQHCFSLFLSTINAKNSLTYCFFLIILYFNYHNNSDQQRKIEMSVSYLNRKEHILQVIDELGSVKVAPLAKELETSEITIRRDLEKLEQEGLLKKTFGGARKLEFSLNEFLYLKRIKQMEREKKRIGSFAANLVKSGDVIFLDTGTTTHHIAQALKNEKGITIITNSILILSELRYVRDLELILLGGNYRPGNFALSGPITEINMENFRAKYAFLGADGITLSNGVTSNDIYTAQITKLMMKYSENPVLVSDHTKIGLVGSIKYSNLEEFHTFITDSNIPADVANTFESRGINIKKV